jgi:hypothetical protein
VPRDRIYSMHPNQGLSQPGQGLTGEAPAAGPLASAQNPTRMEKHRNPGTDLSLPPAKAPRPPATGWEFLWLCGLILSFSYELPLATLFPYDRLNPRFFDVFLALGVLTVLPGRVKRTALPPAFRIWTKLVLVYAACALVWFPFLPLGVARFPLWFAFKYGLSTVCLYMVVSIPLTSKQKQTLMRLAVLGGLIVAAYAWGEYKAGGYDRMLPDGTTLPRQEGVLYSCLGPTYFHVAMYGSISYAVALALANVSASIAGRMLWLATAGIVLWPALFCGSRAGLFCPVITTVAAFWFMPRIRGLVVAMLLAIGLFGGYGGLTASKSYERFEQMEEEQRNTIKERLILKGYSFESYDNLRRYLIPLIGGGFYVVPMQTGGQLSFRIGYGIHNSYLFALEQGGLAAFVLFGLFILKSAKALGERMTAPGRLDRALATGIAAYGVGLIAVAFGGQVFWLMDGTVNLMYYQLVLIMLAITPCVPDDVRASRRSRVAARERKPWAVSGSTTVA